MQKASIGRIVVIHGHQANGQEEHPAIVNCVHSVADDGQADDPYFYCNVTMFPDCDPPKNVTSVYVFQNREQALDYQTRQSVGKNSRTLVGFFPEQV